LTLVVLIFLGTNIVASPTVTCFPPLTEADLAVTVTGPVVTVLEAGGGCLLACVTVSALTIVCVTVLTPRQPDSHQHCSHLELHH